MEMTQTHEATDTQDIYSGVPAWRFKIHQQITALAVKGIRPSLLVVSADILGYCKNESEDKGKTIYSHNPDDLFYTYGYSVISVVPGPQQFDFHHKDIEYVWCSGSELLTKTQIAHFLLKALYQFPGDRVTQLALEAILDLSEE